MTQEEKHLLLIDLCARLPYSVKCRFEINVDKYKTIEFSSEGPNGLVVDFDGLYCYWFNEGYILPYLRPMSSMTEEEKHELYNIRPYFINSDDIVSGTQCNTFIQASECQDWLNEHHFDYRGLIEKGLALEAPEGMYYSTGK